MRTRVVVTGTGAITPLGNDVKSTWKNVLAGKSGVGQITVFNTTGFQTTIAAEVKDFVASEVIGKKLSKRLDKFSHYALAAAIEAVNSARLDMNREVADRVGVLVSSGVGGIQTIAEAQEILTSKGPGRVSPFAVPRMLNDMASGNISIFLGAQGPNYSLVSACATGTDSIGEAAALIRSGRIDVAIVGGSEASVCPLGLAAFAACQALSRRNDEPTRASRPFDAARDGFVIGDGAGILVLESLEHANKRGAEPIVELVGYGSTSDANHITQPAEDGEGASRAMRYALAEANIHPSEIAYINAHGTSTMLNDKMETQAIKTVFESHAYKVPISSTKSMTGHLLGASGAVEAIFATKAISESIAPPTINLEEPDHDCDLDYIPHLARRGRIPTAMSNSFGFGGHNASLVFSALSN